MEQIAIRFLSIISWIGLAYGTLITLTTLISWYEHYYTVKGMRARILDEVDGVERTYRVDKGLRIVVLCACILYALP